MAEAVGARFSAHVPEFLEEDGLGQEFKEMISCLPKEEGWFSSHQLYQYQGFWRPARMIRGIILSQKHFQVRDSDIILVTTPKSGTTWLKALAYATLYRNQYPVDNLNQNHPLLTTNSHDLVPFLEHDLYNKTSEVLVDPNNDFLGSSPSSTPRLLASLSAYVSLTKTVKDLGCKIVYLCRDSKDTLISLWKFSNKLRSIFEGSERSTMSLEHAFHKFCRGMSTGGPFWDHVLGYWIKSLKKLEKVLFLRYKELTDQSIATLKRLAEYIGCPFSLKDEANGKIDNTIRLCSFDNLSNLEVNQTGQLSRHDIKNASFFQQGKVGFWKNYLTKEMSDKMDSITEHKLGSHGLKL